MRKQRTSQPSSDELEIHSQTRKVNRKPNKARQVGGPIQHRPRRPGSVRAGLAVIAGRTAGALSRRLHLGGGTSIAGVVAQRVYPQIVEHLATQLEHGSILVTGTNGKTTTSSFLSAILRDGGLRVWHNREGSNLMRGVASTLVIRALPDGRLRGSGRAISILEVDEAALPQVVQVVSPRVVVFTNLFRDQLDRYGEVHSVIAHWQRAISLLPPTTTLVLNADDPSIAQLGEGFPGKVLYFGIDDASLDLPSQQDAPERHQVADTHTCPRCGHEYTYTLRFFSHMGHYHCTNCSQKRPQPDIRATHVRSESFDRLHIQIETSDHQQDVVVPLPGLYNIYNALTAASASLALNIDWPPIVSGIEQFKPAFGRGERIQAEGRTIRLLLAKNPTGFNEVLRTLFSDGNSRRLLFVLNDNIADGRDISWIWDVDFERAVGMTQSLVVSGTRGLDLALRLKYAGLTEDDMTIIPSSRLRASGNAVPLRSRRGRLSRHPQMVDDEIVADKPKLPPQSVYGLKKALETALAQTPAGETLFIVPTYTGLLEVHRELEQSGLVSHYWEGRDS